MFCVVFWIIENYCPAEGNFFVAGGGGGGGGGIRPFKTIPWGFARGDGQAWN